MSRVRFALVRGGVPAGLGLGGRVALGPVRGGFWEVLAKRDIPPSNQ